MKGSRLTIANMYWYIRYILEQNGLLSTEYSIGYGYPNEEKIVKFPTITISKNTVRAVSLELTAKDRKRVSIVVDIFGNTDTQRDDITDILFEYFDGRTLKLYDFNIAFPTTVGDYSGIPCLGDMYVEKAFATSLQMPTFVNVDAKRWHDMIILDIILPTL